LFKKSTKNAATKPKFLKAMN